MSELNRRDLLKSAAGASLAISGAGVILAGCGASSSTSTTGSGGNPKPGGTLRVGITGGAISDTFDPHKTNTLADWARMPLLFEGLVGSDSTGRPRLLLADELSPNEDATEWTIRVKKGILFHNGKELTADDVIYTFRRILDPKEPGSASVSLELIDVANIKKLDKYTIRVPMKRPYAILDQIISGGFIMGTSTQAIVPEGFDPKRPVGTGPFSYVSFSPNVETVVKKNEHYWKTGLPYLDQVVMTNYMDEASQVNALISGQEQAINSVSFGSVAQIEASGQQLLVSDSGLWITFPLRVDSKPYDDVNVRQAIRTVMNRKEIIDQVYGGHGTLGNDIPGIFSPEYDHSIPQREQDIEEAQALLKKAGQSNTEFELVAAPVAQGTVQVAEVLTQQANAAGINVKLKRTTTDEYFGPNYLQWPFSVNWWLGIPYLLDAQLSSVKGATFNETHFQDAQYSKLFNEAIATPDEAQRKRFSHEMQRIEWERGGFVLPLFAPTFDGHSPSVNGLTPTLSGLSLHDCVLSSVWLS